MLSKAKLALQNYRFKLWRLRHPQATFKDYFAAIAKDDLARGRQHPSLGEHLKWGDRAELGGASFKRSNALLRPGGRLVALGASSVQEGETRSLRRALPQALRMMRGFDLIKQMSDSKSFIGINMKRLWDDRGTLAPWIEPLGAFLDDGTVAPVVHAAIPFDRAGEAHRILAARENVGKVVLVP